MVDYPFDSRIHGPFCVVHLTLVYVDADALKPFSKVYGAHIILIGLIKNDFEQ